MNEKLKKLYYDPIKGLTNVNTFYQRVKEEKIKASFTQVKNFYENQPLNQIYKEKNKHETMSSIIAFNVGSCLKADLLDIKKFKFKNSNYKYLLNVVDVYSRFAWSFPVKSKTASEVLKHVEEVYKDVKQHVKTSPENLTTDDGNEFTNKLLESLNKKYNIKHYTIVSKGAPHPTRTAIVERFNRTLWNLIRKYTETIDTVKFIDVLQDLMKNYNSNIHSGIQAKPIDVYNKKTLPNTEINVAEKFKIGDYVRVKQKPKKICGKSYDIKYSRFIFEVVKIQGTGHILKNISTNRELQKPYQYDNLILVPKETIKDINTNKQNEEYEIKKNESTKRKNLKEGLNINKDSGKVEIPKRLIPNKSKRISNKVVK